MHSGRRSDQAGLCNADGVRGRGGLPLHIPQRQQGTEDGVSGALNRLGRLTVVITESSLHDDTGRAMPGKL